jgi:hypothetical protein
MTKLGVLGATALSLSLAIATPVLAQQAPGGRTGAHAAAGNMGGARMSSGPRMQSNFRRAQPNMGRANFAGRGNAQFARGDRGVNGGGEFRDGRGFGRDSGFAVGAAVAGVATGAAIASGGYGYSNPYYGDNYGYDTNYGDNYANDQNGYGDSYAYDNGATFNAGLPLVTFNQPAQVGQAPMGDASYCAQRYRSFDPASGTYLGYDGLRHPCM